MSYGMSRLEMAGPFADEAEAKQVRDILAPKQDRSVCVMRCSFAAYSDPYTFENLDRRQELARASINDKRRTMSRYLMNPHSGTVQTAVEWAADGFDERNAELIEVASLDGKHWHELEDFATLMDGEIRETLHSKVWASDQHYLDAYAVAHEARFNEVFSYE
jgi:hypothetical protein